MATVKLRPDFPNFGELYTGVADDSLSRIKSSVRHISPDAAAYGVGSSGVLDNVVARVEDEHDYTDDSESYDFDSEEDQRLAEALSQETPEAEVHVGSVSHYLHSDFGIILSMDRRTGSVNIDSFDDEDSMYETWDQHLLSSRRREY
jgi:hypothetical protein